MENKIKIKGARTHNLKNISLEIPREQIIVFTGVSGSGKSSLAFDTIFAEGQRRYIESLSPYVRQFLGQMDRPDVDEITGLSPAIAIDQKALSHNPRSTVGTLTEIYDYLRVLFARIGEVYCPTCNREIQKLALDEIVDLIITKAKELKETTTTILSPIVRGRKGEYYQILYDFLKLGFSQVRIDGEIKPLRERIILNKNKKHNIEILIDRILLSDKARLSEAVESAMSHSNGLVLTIFDEGKKNEEEVLFSSNWTCPDDGFSFPEVEPRLFSFNSPYGACEKCHGLGKEDTMLGTICSDCNGLRLKHEALSVRIAGKNIAEVSGLSIGNLLEFFIALENKLNKRKQKIAENVLKEIIDRLGFLEQVGLDYLALEREAETLSGGEAQRIRLASQIGSQLSGALYVLDEPTIGLHERDTERLIRTIKSLKEKKNTIIVVEHDEMVIKDSDYFVDLGPLAGRLGGEVVAEGETSKLLKNSKSFLKSLTLQYLTGEINPAPPRQREKTTEKLQIIGARANNLKNLDVEIPLRKMVVFTGVSGSGKSSLLYDVLYKNAVRIKSRFGEDRLKNVSKILGTEYIDKIIMVDQSPIGRTPRSNPATYTGIWTPIRDFYTELPEARERGYKAGRFSFNVKGGRCESCQGAGHNLIEMHFLPPVLVECEVCHGKRFSRETLEVKYKNKNVANVLDMTIDEATEFFDDIWQIAEKLKALQGVGLGYLKLGQSATTLSGGEAQRIKLGRELTHPLGKRALYILDEPTVGLHYHDVEMLLEVLNKLIDKQNSVIMIEHNMQVIKSADYIIDLGPEGGEAGGKLIAKGTPYDISQNKYSFTGKYLKKHLK